MKEEGMENYYPGDNEWSKYVNFYTEYNDGNVYRLLKLLNNHLDMAIVIYGYFGMEESLRWVTYKIPVLNNLRPIDCLENEALLKRLKTALMRLP